MTFDIKIRVKDLFGFTLYHSYAGIFGKMWLGLSIVALIGFFVTFGTVTPQYSAALLFIGLLFTVINPILLYQKCASRMKKTKEAYELPFCYTCEANGILLVQGENKVKYTWDMIFQFVETKKAVYMMMDPMHACIIPKDQLGEKKQEFMNYIKETVPAHVRKKGFR
jgi:hypothetical protein